MADAWWMPPGSSGTGSAQSGYWGGDGSFYSGSAPSADSWGTLGGMTPPGTPGGSSTPTSGYWGTGGSFYTGQPATWANPPAPAAPTQQAQMQPWEMPPSSGVKMVNGSLTPMSSADLTQYGMFGLRP
jgi:hypothetical protein